MTQKCNNKPVGEERASKLSIEIRSLVNKPTVACFKWHHLYPCEQISKNNKIIHIHFEQSGRILAIHH